jgi:hypothetical protein
LVLAVVLAFCVPLRFNFKRPPALKKYLAWSADAKVARAPNALVILVGLDPPAGGFDPGLATVTVQAVLNDDPATTAELEANDNLEV